jgi:hypothetical protein
MQAGAASATMLLSTSTFSPSIYAQGECFLMRRNCNCTCQLAIYKDRMQATDTTQQKSDMQNQTCS